MTTWNVDGGGWVDGSIFGFKVEHEEVKRPGGEAYLRLDESSKLGNLHTSEGFSMDGLIATLRAKGFAGQWCAGDDRIVQTRPVWAQGSLLLGGSSTNFPMRMEVEQVAFTKSTLWTPEVSTFEPIAALVAFYNVAFGVPLKVPIASWQDDGGDISPAFFGANNRRTQAGNAGLGNLTGWIHHCEVPQNLHADCGAYNRSALFAAAKKLVDSLTPGDDPVTDADVKKIVDGVKAELEPEIIEARDNSILNRRLADALRTLGHPIAPTTPGEPWASDAAKVIAAAIGPPEPPPV